MGYIYLITNTVNGKKYVGQTLENDINVRWNHHKSSKKGCPYLKRAIEKYGINIFKFQIICICFDEDCNYYEPYYIKKFNSLSPNGYNLMTGGGNSKHIPETILKISEANKNRIHTPLSEETKKKISQAKKGENSYNYGMKISEEQKEKTRETWRKKKEEGKIKLTEQVEEILKNGRQKGIEYNKLIKQIPVGQYTKDNVFIKKFSGACEAKDELNIDRSTILKVCKGIRKTAGGFIWKYLSKDDTLL